MSEPLKPDVNPSLTPFVRQFTRVARLAAADPLRLLPLDPLTQLAALGAPVAALLDVAPFERLRDAIAGPAAVRRGHVARGRLQPFSDRDVAGRTRAPALSAAPPSGATGPAVPAAARQVTAARETDPLSSAPQPLGREPASMTTLAERRAAVRRGTAEPASRSRSTTPEVAHTNAGNSVSAAPSRAREISLRHARDRNEETPDLARHEEPATPFAARVLRQARQEPLPIEERTAVPGPSDVVLPPAETASLEAPLVGDRVQSTFHRTRVDLEASAPSGVVSPRSGPPSSRAAGAMPQADATAARRHRASEPITDLEPADELFETLYREGVDLSWP